MEPTTAAPHSPVAERAPDDPRWTTEVLLVTRAEFQLFGATLLALLRPRRFGEEWAAGRRALNPLLFAVQAVAIAAAWKWLFRAFVAGDRPEAPIAAQVFVDVRPYLFAGVASLLGHAAVRLAGSRRPLRSTVAMALYTVGPMAVLALFTGPLDELRSVWPAARGPFRALQFAAIGVHLVVFSGLLAGLHRVRRWVGIAAVLVTFVLFGFAVGTMLRMVPDAARWLR